ncbi:MAG: YcaO-like family protein [Gemmataceae bacterium]
MNDTTVGGTTPCLPTQSNVHDLIDVVERYVANLPQGQLRHFPIVGLDRLSVGVHVADFTLSKGVQLNGFGYGASAQEAAVGAFGELSETSHCTVNLGSRVPIQGTYPELVEKRGERGVVDPLSLCLPAGSPYHAGMHLLWTEALRYPTQEVVLVPWEFAAVYPWQMCGHKALITPITNGLGAGLNFDQSLSHGLLELLQRDGNCTSFRAMDQGVVIELDEVTDPELRGILEHIQSEGVEILAKLASTEFGLVNLYVVGWDVCNKEQLGPPIQVTACGEAVHPNNERALRKAILEFAAARVRKTFSHGPLDKVRAVSPTGYLEAYAATFKEETQEPRALEAMIEWCSADRERLVGLLSDKVFSQRTAIPLTSLSSLDDVVTPGRRLEVVVDRLRQAGMDILYFDYSPVGGDISVTKAIVPGLECETMSYRRIGERGLRKLMQRSSPMAGIGERPEHALEVLLTSDALERLGGPAWLDPRVVDDVVGDLYPLYREPNSHAAQLVMARRATKV